MNKLRSKATKSKGSYRANFTFISRVLLPVSKNIFDVALVDFDVVDLVVQA